MHECPLCGQACDCDGEDLWYDEAPPGCTCECDFDDDDDWDEDEWEDEDDGE